MTEHPRAKILLSVRLRLGSRWHFEQTHKVRAANDIKRTVRAERHNVFPFGRPRSRGRRPLSAVNLGYHGGSVPLKTKQKKENRTADVLYVISCFDGAVIPCVPDTDCQGYQLRRCAKSDFSFLFLLLRAAHSVTENVLVIPRTYNP